MQAHAGRRPDEESVRNRGMPSEDRPLPRPRAEPAPAALAPADAQLYYKVVAVESPHSFVSIFDGRTPYRLGEVTSPPGGCWVSPDLLSVVRHGARLPSRSARLASPRAILKVQGWNAGSTRPVTPAGHESSTTKVLVTHVLPVAILPYTAAGQPGTPAGQEHMLSDTIAALVASNSRPLSTSPRPESLRVSAGLAARRYGGGEEQALRLQAHTAALHEDVLHMQARLERARGVANVSSSAPSGWVRRALGRIGVDADAPLAAGADGVESATVARAAAAARP